MSKIVVIFGLYISLSKLMENGWLIFFACVTAYVLQWLYFKYKREKKKNVELSKELTSLQIDKALLEAEYLKFQLQPHTLNNILTNLQLFAKKLHKGMDSLSLTLDYILYKGKNHFVSVKDEIDFIQKYLELNDLFSSQIESISFDVSMVSKASKYYEQKCIPHLITAPFIENAFKHGNDKHPDFLKIKLFLNHSVFVIEVMNKIKPNNIPSKKGGLGLNNMYQRLDILLPDQYKIDNSHNESEYTAKLTINLK